MAEVGGEKIAGTRIGVIAIGRNEGERLVRCLASLSRVGGPMVYVDSASTDDSIAAAHKAKASVVSLDMSQPFSAARARNAGIGRLLSIDPDIEYVFFVDGDCEVVEGWTEAAIAFLDEHPRVAVVCGRRRERFPHASVWNALIDREWDTPVGEAEACGGDAVMRLAPVLEMGGFDATLIANEEPDLCRRMRNTGWKVWRLDVEMTLHDAALNSFGQVLKRARRSGFGYAQTFAKDWRFNAQPGRIVLRALAWTVLLPAICLVLALLWRWEAVLLAPAVWLLQFLRLAIRGRHPELTVKAHLANAASLVLGKFAEARGIFEFAWKRLRGQKMDAIFYKV